MKTYLLIIPLLFLNGFTYTQTTIFANANEYVEAENYGGKVELKRFLQNEMNYPKIAIENKEEGTVQVVFVVDSKTGKSSDAHISQSVSPEIDKEALRLHSLLLFTASKYKDNKISTRASIKIKFTLKKYKKYCKKRKYNNIELNDTTINYNTKIFSKKELDVKAKPFFKDTLNNLSRFVSKNMRYPNGTLKLNLTGVVKLSFVIEPSGRITNIRVLKGLGGGATNEAQRLLKLTKWIPAQKNGKKVRSSEIFDINFNLSQNAGYNYVPGQM